MIESQLLIMRLQMFFREEFLRYIMKKKWKNLYYLKTRYFIGIKEENFSHYYEKVCSLEVKVVVLNLKACYFSIRSLLHIYCCWQYSSSSVSCNIFSHNMQSWGEAAVNTLESWIIRWVPFSSYAQGSPKYQHMLVCKRWLGWILLWAFS